MNLHFNFQLRLLLLNWICSHSPVFVRSWEVEFNRNFLCTLGKIIRVQEMIWFVSDQMNATNSAGCQELIISMYKCLGLTQSILSNRTDIRFIQSENKKHALSVVFTTTPEDPILHVHDLALRGRHFYISLLIAVNIVHDFKVVEQFLLGLNKRHFHSSLLYFYTSNRTNELFGNNMYPEVKPENRSNYLEEIRQLLNKTLAGGADMLGYKMYTPLRQDLPHVFGYVNASGQINWRGAAYNLLEVFTNYCNSSLIEYEMPKDRLGGDVIDMKAALELIRRSKVAVMAHAYALFQEDDELSKSYPLKVVRWCLMVPVWNSATTMLYPVEPFDNWTWFGIVGVFGALVVTKCLWCCWQGTHQLATRLGESVLNSFCLSIGIGTPNVFGAPSVVDFLIFACIFFYGFFLTSNYTSLLGSIFTVTLFRAQINTMDDLISANISVMIIDYELEFLHSSGEELAENFSRLILPVDSATFNLHQVQLNSSFAYFVTEEKWHFLELQQKYLKQGIFKFSDICFGSYHLTYPLQTDSLLYRNLEYFIYRTHSSGMLDHYESTAFDYAVKAGLVKRLAANSEFTSAGMQHLAVVFFMLLIMLGVSFIVFVIELQCARFKNE
ncbi:uncharacterized protein LOC129245378 [Anastrepha obliqua]|uniref:uncharacterized protein LOC129245378 n=1 Tax=Anastrepha obliqua TaxID=95512 RepID=UPI002409E9E7|nr:uncharacterized protein LOC129245378 [Anastrepha obliqua]